MMLPFLCIVGTLLVLFFYLVGFWKAMIILGIGSGGCIVISFFEAMFKDGLNLYKNK